MPLRAIYTRMFDVGNGVTRLGCRTIFYHSANFGPDYGGRTDWAIALLLRSELGWRFRQKRQLIVYQFISFRLDNIFLTLPYAILKGRVTLSKYRIRIKGISDG